MCTNLKKYDKMTSIYFNFVIINDKMTDVKFQLMVGLVNFFYWHPWARWSSVWTGKKENLIELNKNKITINQLFNSIILSKILKKNVQACS